MVAFWEEIKERPSLEKGSCRLWPELSDERYTWQKQLYSKFEEDKEILKHEKTSVVPFPLDRVWEDVDVKKNKIRNKGVSDIKYLPNYDLCFQGF